MKGTDSHKPGSDGLNRLLAVRLQPDWQRRADALIPHVAADPQPELAALVRVTRSTVLRLAIARGIALLEERYPERKKR